MKIRQKSGGLFFSTGKTKSNGMFKALKSGVENKKKGTIIFISHRGPESKNSWARPLFLFFKHLRIPVFFDEWSIQPGNSYSCYFYFKR